MRTIETFELIRSIQACQDRGCLAAQTSAQDSAAPCVYEGVVGGKVVHCAIGSELTPREMNEAGNVSVASLVHHKVVDFQHREIAALIQAAHDKWASGFDGYNEGFFNQLLRLVSDTNFPDREV